MIGRLLALCAWTGIHTGIYHFDESDQGTAVASKIAQSKATLQELHQQSFLGSFWKRDEKETEAVHLEIVQSPLLSVAASSSQNSSKSSNDLVLSDMQAEQRRASRVLPLMPGTLVSGVDAAEKAIKEQKCEGSILLQKSGRLSITAAGERVGSFSGQSSMDSHDACQSHSDQEGRQHRGCRMQQCSRTAGDAALQFGGYRCDANARRGKVVGASQGSSECQSRLVREHAEKTGSSLGQAAEQQHYQATQSWTFESSTQTQDASDQCREENCRVRPRMVRLCREDDVESERACNHVPNMPCRHVGDVQQEVGRAGVSQERAQHSLAADASIGADRASSDGATGRRCTSACNAGSHRRGKCGRACGSHRRHGGRGRADGRRASRTELQSFAQGVQSIQGRYFTDEGSPSAPEGKIPRQQGEQDQGVVCSSVVQEGSRDHGSGSFAEHGCFGWNEKMQHMWKDAYIWTECICKDTSVCRGVEGPKGSFERETSSEREGVLSTFCSHVQSQDDISVGLQEYEPLHFAGGASWNESDRYEDRWSLLHMNRGLVRGCREGNLDLSGPQAISFCLWQLRHEDVDGGHHTWCQTARLGYEVIGNIRDRERTDAGDDFMDSDFSCQNDDRMHGDRHGDCSLEQQNEQYSWNGGKGNSDLPWFHAKGDAEQSRSGDGACGTYKSNAGCSSVGQRCLPYGALRCPKVRFDECVSLVCFHDESTIFADIGMDEFHRCCRSLWHMHGQIADFGQFPKVLACHSGTSDVDEQGKKSELVHRLEGNSAESRSSETTAESSGWKEYNDESQGCLTSETIISNDAWPIFADTWFVAEERFHLCIQPRRLKLSDRFWQSAVELEQKCRELWQDRDNGEALRFQVIDHVPMRLPSTKFHIVIVQGDLIQQQWAMLFSAILPPLYRHRVAIFPSDGTVNDFFRAAQVEGACTDRARSCFIKFHDGRQEIFLENEERMEVPGHRFVEGGIRMFEDEQGGEVADRGSESEVSTMVPDSENEDGDDAVSMVLTSSISSNGGILSSNVPGTTLQTESQSDGGEDNMDLTWSWVTYCGHHQDRRVAHENEDEISSLMATDPLAQQIHNPGVQPWMAVANEQDEMDLVEEEGISISFAHNQLELTQHHIEVILADLLENQQDELWTVVTFGLGLVDLGRRDTTFHPRDIDGLMRRVLELWEDHAQYGDLSLYFVSPQPMDIAGEKSIVLIVQVNLQDAHDPAARCVLVLERAVQGVRVRAQHYAAYLLTNSIMNDLLQQLDLQEHCPPFTTRDCGMRLGMTTLNDEQIYDFEHGTYCLAWIGPRPEEVELAMQRIENAEAFFTQFRRLMAFQPEREHVTLAVHGISPNNKPMGRRDGIFNTNEIPGLAWIDFIAQLWPFGNADCKIVFIPDLTRDMQELGWECFNFIVSYGGQNEVAIMIHQQVGAVDDLPHQATTVDEFWALRVPRESIAHNMPGIALGPPFWFRYARAQNVYPHMFVEGQRARETHRNWQHGDVLTARFHVWQRHHVLTMPMREGDDDGHDQTVEETSFLQMQRKGRTNQYKWESEQDDSVGEVFAEICHALWHQEIAAQKEDECVTEILEMKGDRVTAVSNAAAEYESCHQLKSESSRECSMTHQYSMQRPVQNQLDHETSHCLSELNKHIDTLMAPDWKGLNSDFALLPSLHPHAEIACQWTKAKEEVVVTFHVFTDGSCRSGKAAWAFVVLCEQKGHAGSQFIRVGYAADRVREDIGPCEQSAQDAEATAIIAAIEYLLSRQNTQLLEVHMHFDAMAVGHGSMGHANTIRQDDHVSTRQRSARVMMSMLQRKQKQWHGCHVHAHQGHPWNEFVDSLAGLATTGWLPKVQAELRSGALLNHCLAEWAWIQVCPNREMPSLEEIMVNQMPQPCHMSIDAALLDNHSDQEKTSWSGCIVFASANVCTLDQDRVLPGQTVTYKAAELMQQFQQEGLQSLVCKKAEREVMVCTIVGHTHVLFQRVAMDRLEWSFG